MIATIGLPGSSCFDWTRVRNAPEAGEWRTAWLKVHGENQETLNAVRQGFELTEKEALKSRWRDGSPIYARRPEWGGGRLAIVCEDWRAELARHEAESQAAFEADCRWAGVDPVGVSAAAEVAS